MSLTEPFSSNINLQRIVLVAVVTALYGVSLANGFVWDDTIFFIGNPVYIRFDIVKILLSPANGVEYLPLRDITYALDYFFWDRNPFGFHLSNLIFFSINIFLVHHFAAMVANKLAESKGRPQVSLFPFVVAALFAVHPLNAEVVNFVTCRNVLVSATFVFLSSIWMFRYLEDGGRKMLLAALVAFVFAMLGKATAIMAPILFLLLYPILFPGQLRRISMALLPFFAVAGVFFLLFKNIADRAGLTNTDFLEFNLWRKIALAVQIPFFYLKKLIIPSGFSVEYVTGFSHSLLSAKGSAAMAALCVIALLAVLSRRKYPEFTVGSVWFIVALLPVLNFFSTHPLVADRYAYLSTFGFIFAAVAAVEKISAAKLRMVVFTAWAIILAALSVERSLDWRSEEALWSANVKNFPLDSKSYANLANAYFNKGEHERAIDLLSQNSQVPWLNIYKGYFLGRHHYLKGDYAAAKEAFQKPLEVVPGYIGALYYLGLIAEKEGNYVAAVQNYNRAIMSSEHDFYMNLPDIRSKLDDLKKNRIDPELEILRRKVEADQADIGARRDLGLALDRLGFYAEALQQYLSIEKNGYKGWPIYQNIANCYFNLNRNSEAINAYEQVVMLGGANEDTYTNIGISYRKTGKFTASADILVKGVSAFPESPYPLFNLGVTYFESGNKEQARSVFSLLERKFPDYKDRVAPYLKK